jgi:hypothetical protein
LFKVRRMNAWPAVTELRLIGAAFVLTGVVGLALSLTDDRQVSGVFVVIEGGALGLAAIAHLVWSLRGLRRAQPASEPLVVGKRWRTFWHRVVPAAGPIAGLVVVNAALGTSSSWVIGAGCVLIGLVMVVEAAMAVRLERRRGSRVLRVEQRFVLAH